jgi:hypothetical protein
LIDSTAVAPTGHAVARLRRWRPGDGSAGAGLLFSIAVAVALFTAFGITGELARDEGIYSYAGQRLAHGVPPYASIFDPKGPGASFLAGAGAAVARVFGADSLVCIRLAFFACSLASVAAMFLLARRLWRSTLAGTVAGVVFACYDKVGADALGGPDAKTPGVLAAVVTMWLLLRRNWFSAGVAAGVGILVWQPLLIYPVVAVALPALVEPAGRRSAASLRALGGVTLPVGLASAYFFVTGAFSEFVQASLVFPLTGIQRDHASVWRRVGHIAHVVWHSYHLSGLLFGIGLVCFLVLVVARLLGLRHRPRRLASDPLIAVVLVTMLFEFAYAATDFQGSPDVLPLLAYPTLGLAGAVAALAARPADATARRAVAGVVVGLLVVLAGFSWTWFTGYAQNGILASQRADACAIDLSAGSGPLLSLGDPVPLVLANRRNPSPYIYLGSGADRWKIRHTAGGFTGWTREIARIDPGVVVVHGWRGILANDMRRWLRSTGRLVRYAGQWQVFVTPGAARRAVVNHVLLTPQRVPVATTLDGVPLARGGCR